mgnify:CR=1 FL=1
MVQKIENRTPLKMRRIDYINYPITRIEVKGMFKIFFGDLVKNFDKPYFTFIEDYVVFSNSADELIIKINDVATRFNLHPNTKYVLANQTNELLITDLYSSESTSIEKSETNQNVTIQFPPDVLEVYEFQ